MSDLHKVMIALAVGPMVIYAATFVSPTFALCVGLAIMLPIFAFVITRP